jgi:kinetochore protein NDC80
LANVVQEQNLTPEEVAKMNSDHEQLSRNLDELRQRISDTHQHVMNLEIAVTKKTESTDDIVDKYMSLLTSLELYPTLPPPRQDVSLALELHPAVSAPQDLLQGADLRRTVKPTLSAIAEGKRIERADLESERIKVENELDQVIQECENVDEEIMELEKKGTSVNDQAEDFRDVSPQVAVVSAV